MGNRKLIVRSRFAARICLVIYAVAALGGFFDAECSCEHFVHTAGTNTARDHVHSKNRLAVHSLIHAASLMDHTFLGSACCCCIYPGNGETELPTHLLVSNRSWSDFSNRLTLTDSSEVNDFKIVDAGMCVLSEGLQTIHSFLSLHTTVLLI